jgi:hypothetical protein
MSPRKTTRKAEEQYPPAPSVEDDAASNGNGGLEKIQFSQEVIDEYLAFERMKELRLENEEEEYVNDDDDGSSQSTVERYEHYEQDEPLSLPSNSYNPAARDQSNQHVVVESPLRPPTPPQYCTIPEPPPPTIILQNLAPTVPVTSLPAGEAGAWSQFLGRVPRHIVPIRQRHPQTEFASTGGYFEDHCPRGVISGGYSRGVGSLGYNRRPYRTMPTGIRGPNETVPFAIARAADRNLALYEEPSELFEMWADTFGRSRRIEEDLTTSRERLPAASILL